MSRIIAGRAKGRRLATPKGANTRPTTDRTREALFSALASWFDAADADAFGERWLGRYLAEFPAVADTASTLVTRPGGPARRLD